MVECPNCGSFQVVPVLRALTAARRPHRAFNRSSDGIPEGFEDWSCGDCGHRWRDGGPDVRERPPVADPDERPPAVPEPDDVEMRPTREAPATVLRRAREERGLAVAEVARATGIWERYLRALEDDEPPEAFPGHAYARFFLREYAQQLGLEPEPLVRAYEDRHVDEGAVEPEAPRVPDPRRRATRVGRVLIAISAVGLLAIGLGPQLFGGERPSVSPAPGAPPASVAAAAPIEPAASVTPPPVRTVLAVLRPSAPCWVAAVADGQTVLYRNVLPGERVTLRADRLLQLRLGNAAGVVLRVNGEPVSTGGSGDVVDLQFRLRDGVLTATRS